MKIILKILIPSILLIFCGGIYHNYKNVLEGVASPYHGMNRYEVADAKNLLNKKLIDPTSSLFEFYGKIPSTDTEPDVSFICGTVNAKNRFNAYTGKSRFVVALSNGEPLSYIENAKNLENLILINTWCPAHNETEKEKNAFLIEKRKIQLEHQKCLRLYPGDERACYIQERYK